MSERTLSGLHESDDPSTLVRSEEQEQQSKRETLEVTRIADLAGLQRPSNLHKKFTVPVRIYEADERTVEKQNGEDVNVLSEVVVRDRKGSTMRMTGVIGDDHVEKIYDALQHSTELELEGELSSQDGRYVLIYRDASPIESMRQLLGVTEQEEEEAEGLIERLQKSPGGVIEYFIQSLVEILGISRLEKSPTLKTALVALALQAVSIGRIGSTIARISILLIGPPGSRKGVLHRAAAILNGIWQLISTTRVTPAGLVGTSERSSGSRERVHPGALVLADRGVASAEDLQHVDSHTSRHFFGILCEMLERGILARTTFREIRIEVQTALLACINPASTVRPSLLGEEKPNLLKDLNLPLNFLTRCDLPIMLDRDVQETLETALDVAGSIKSVGPEDYRSVHGKRIRGLQVMVAVICDMCPKIDLSGVSGLIRERVKDLFDKQQEKLEKLNIAADFMLRCGNTSAKLVAGFAKLDGRCEAVEEDVNRAFSLLGGERVITPV